MECKIVKKEASRCEDVGTKQAEMDNTLAQEAYAETINLSPYEAGLRKLGC